MSQSRNEYTGVVTGGKGKQGAYSNLGCYYGQQGTMAPIRPTNGSYIIPNWGSIGYAALTKGGVGNYKSYYNINDAYGSDVETTFSNRLCGGCNVGSDKCTQGPAYYCASDQNFAECVQSKGYNGMRCSSDSPCKKTTYCPVV